MSIITETKSIPLSPDCTLLALEEKPSCSHWFGSRGRPGVYL